MNDHLETSNQRVQGRLSASEYEPPKIERVITGADIEREVMFAGIPISGRGGD